MPVMMSEAQSREHFVADSLIRSCDHRNLLYAHLGERAFQFGTGEGAVRDLLAEAHDVVRAYLIKHVAMGTAEPGQPLEDVYFHKRFGWVLCSRQGKAYLGKMVFSSGITLRMGLMSYFSGKAELVGTGRLAVGAFTSIADGFYAFTSYYGHRVDAVSTYNFGANPRMLEEGLEFGTPFVPPDGSEASIVLGSDVWLARDVTVHHGVRVGDGAVVYAGSRVTRDCEPYGVYAGSPARLLRRRFPEPVVAQLLALRWWEWPMERLRRNSAFFALNLATFEGDLAAHVVV